MKRIILAISVLAVIAGLSTSCQKEMALDNNSPTANSGITVTATIADNGTKVSYEENDSHDLIPTWVVNDIVIGFDGDGNTYGYKVTAVNEGVATLTIITEGDFAGTATSDPANGTTMYMIYAPGTKPSAINTTEKSLTVSLANQSEDVVPALMMAQATVANSSLSLSFENKTAIIGIKTPTMATAGKTYTGIAVSGTGINTEVKFGLSAEGELEATYQKPGKIIKAVDFTSGADCTTSATIYVAACPQTTAADLTFTASNAESFTKAGKTMEDGNYYYTTPTFLAPPAALPGVFTVGPDATDKVHFSRGNLRCNPVGTPGAYTSGIWSFFDEQYECGPADYVDGHDREISLFTWGYDATKSVVPDGTDFVEGHQNDGESFDDSEDWGSQIGGGNTWRTLTIDEWIYLVFERTVNNGTEEGYSYQRATINSDVNSGVFGTILYPDNYSETAKTSYTSDEWTSLEAAGCVFLPAAGIRFADGIINVGNGYYQSSSADNIEDNRQFIYFGSDFVYDNAEHRMVGFSVRLVTE